VDAGERQDDRGLGGEIAAAREALGLTLRDMEERTKIRRRYLEALEQERWSSLPSRAHTHAFLRTVAGELGLDADELADRFRREVDPGEAPGEPGGPARWPVLAAVALLAGAGAAALVVTAGDDGSKSTRRAAKGDRPGADDASQPGRRRERGPAEAFALTLTNGEPVELCLVAGDDRALIDSQRLAAGATEGPFEGDEFRLDLLSGGSLRATIGDRRVRLRSEEPARWSVTSRGALPQALRGESCP
jgi:transcriptional regulator with XRE-family HTH domain